MSNHTSVILDSCYKEWHPGPVKVDVISVFNRYDRGHLAPRSSDPLQSIDLCTFQVCVTSVASGEILDIIEAQGLNHVRNVVKNILKVTRSQLPLSAFRARYFMEEGARAERRG